jgi:hypothetical protein
MRTVPKVLSVGLLALSAAVGLVAASAVGAAAAPANTARTATTAAVSLAAASPGTGFGYGSDSWPVPVTGGSPYLEPVTGGNYSGYMGMAGNWARTEGCKTGNQFAWSPVNAGQANANFGRSGIGTGTGVYWYMGGPGVDPHWNGTTTEAYDWGKLQASWALAWVKGKLIPYSVLWADIELPEIAPAPDNGWNSVYTSPCSGVVRQSYVPAVVDRSVLAGFESFVTSHSKDKVGVYSAPTIWPRIFGTGQYATLTNTYEWTYWPETRNLSAAPTGWCLHGTSTCAQFFGGQTSASKYALMWQWSGGGGVTNGVGDFDQIDLARMK